MAPPKTIKTRRLSLNPFSDFHYKWGKLWAFAKRRSLAKMIGDVFEARVEANRGDIELMIRDIAEQRGLTYEELVAQVMDGDEEKLDD
jgi:hypothetical protein